MISRMKPLPPIERLNELLEYDEVTGVIRWRVTRGRTAKAGDEAGYISKGTGYRLIGIDGQNYMAARIAWALHYGVDPYPAEVDHKNRNRADNGIGNLRLATRSEQMYNRAASGISGERYVIWDGDRGRWMVCIEGRYGGRFKVKVEAVAQRDRMLRDVTSP
jgi:hypothetical protein